MTPWQAGCWRIITIFTVMLVSGWYAKSQGWEKELHTMGAWGVIFTIAFVAFTTLVAVGAGEGVYTKFVSKEKK